VEEIEHGETDLRSGTMMTALMILSKIIQPDSTALSTFPHTIGFVLHH